MSKSLLINFGILLCIIFFICFLFFKNVYFYGKRIGYLKEWNIRYFDLVSILSHSKISTNFYWISVTFFIPFQMPNPRSIFLWRIPGPFLFTICRHGPSSSSYPLRASLLVLSSHQVTQSSITSLLPRLLFTFFLHRPQLLLQYKKSIEMKDLHKPTWFPTPTFIHQNLHYIHTISDPIIKTYSKMLHCFTTASAMSYPNHLSVWTTEPVSISQSTPISPDNRH